MWLAEGVGELCKRSQFSTEHKSPELVQKCHVVKQLPLGKQNRTTGLE